jgi:hypothetical protein
MLTPRLINSSECGTITTLIEDIDCKLAKESSNLYNNLVFMLNYPVPAKTILSLLHYKRILQYKYVNSDYACAYSVEQIASRVKLLKYK